jgi:hypothetical protein
MDSAQITKHSMNCTNKDHSSRSVINGPVTGTDKISKKNISEGREYTSCRTFVNIYRTKPVTWIYSISFPHTSILVEILQTCPHKKKCTVIISLLSVTSFLPKKFIDESVELNFTAKTIILGSGNSFFYDKQDKGLSRICPRGFPGIFPYDHKQDSTYNGHTCMYTTEYFYVNYSKIFILFTQYKAFLPPSLLGAL